MASAPNFASILDESPKGVERPPALPEGTYLCVVAGPPQYGESSKKKTPYAQFTLRIIEAEDDVDEDAIEACGGVVGKTLRSTYYLTEDAVYRLDEFLSHCGIDIEDDRSRRQRIEDTLNANVRVYVKQRPSDDGERVFAEVARTLSAD